MCSNGTICKNIKNNLRKLKETNYKEYIKTVISVEFGIEDDTTLEKLYEKYMESEETSILINLNKIN